VLSGVVGFAGQPQALAAADRLDEEKPDSTDIRAKKAILDDYAPYCADVDNPTREAAEAEHWLRKAANAGNHHAKTHLNLLGKGF
jgi:hypothetical protein